MDEIEKSIRSQLLYNSYEHRNEQWNFVGLEYRLREVGSVERAALVTCCKALLTDPDLEIRSGIVAILNEIARNLDAEWMFNKLKDHPELFVGIAPKGAKLNTSTLDREITTVICSLVKKSHSAIIEYLRECVGIDELKSWVLPALAKVDAAWLVENAAKVVSQEDVCVLLPMSQERRLKVIYILAPWPPDTLKKLGSFFWMPFDPEEAKVMKALMRGK